MIDDPGYLVKISTLDPSRCLVRIMPPFSKQRLKFYRSANSEQAKSIPRGPEIMSLEFTGGQPKIRGMGFGREAGQARLLFDWFLDIYPQEIEGDLSVVEADFSGDFLFQPNVAMDEYRKDLETLLAEELGGEIVLTVHEVEREVRVLHGDWVRTALAIDDCTNNIIEIYGRDLESGNCGNRGSGNTAQWARELGRYLSQTIVVEAANAPKSIAWRFNGLGDRTRESCELATNLELVLKHIQEQTGLMSSMQTRRVRRLLIQSSGERKPPKRPPASEAFKKKRPNEITEADVAEAMLRDRADELLHIPLAVAMHWADLAAAQDILVRLSKHEDYAVRGNAIGGFGNMASRLRRPVESIARPIVEAGLVDEDEYVREKANHAADTLERYLRWTFARPAKC